MKNKILMSVGITLGAVLLLTGCGKANLKDGSEVAFKVNGEKVSADEIYKTLKERLDTEETSLKTNLDQLKTDSVIVDYMNRFDESSLTDGRVENDGSIIIYATYKHSDYIPVDS